MKECYLVEVRELGTTEWREISRCGSMAEAVPVADAAHNLSFLFAKPLAVRIRERSNKEFGGLTVGKER